MTETLFSCQGDTVVEQPAPRRKAKVLVALDDGGQRIVMKAQLCRDGHDVDVCINGGKVWEMIRTQGGDSWAHDIVFLEYNLRDRGACAIAVDIRAEEDRRRAEAIKAGRGDDEPLQKLFVVGVTSKVDPETQAECMKAGMNTVISKPIERSVIRGIVDQALENVSTTSPVSAENVPIRRKPSSELNRSTRESPHIKSSNANSDANTPTDARTVGELPLIHVENKTFARSPSVCSKHVKVLVVDDDGGQRIMLKSALVREGYEVVTVANGIEAIEIVEQKRFDVIVMDGMMPSMTGWEATRKIREQERHKNLVPIIIVGVINPSFPHEANQCIEAGMSTTCSKPLDRAKLIGEISKWIEVRMNYVSTRT
jgi:CheY-like chemotaxis protein